MKNIFTPLILLSLFTSCSVLRGTQYNGDSPNFDGKRFLNLEKTPDKNFWTYLKMRMKTTQEKWPKEIAVQKATVPNHREEELKITFINHSSFLIQYKNLNILTDPIFSQRASPYTWIGPNRVAAPGLEIKDLPPIDVILISHDHYDHLDLKSLSQLDKLFSPKIFAGLGVGKVLTDARLANFKEMDWWDKHEFNEILDIHFVPAQHFSGRGLFDRNTTLWGGFVFSIKGENFFFAGDTGFGKHFQLIKDRFKTIDFAFIPIGAYAPRYFMKYNHIDPHEAMKAHKILDPDYTFGMHWGTFQLTNEKRNEPKKTIEVLAQENNISNFKTFENGKVYSFKRVGLRHRILEQYKQVLSFLNP